MSIGYDSWAVDLGEVGPIYPMQGWEIPMVVVGVIFWLVWHRLQFVQEGKDLEQAKQIADADKIAKAIERY
ncbi:hypothetical protein HKX54_18720 [Sulfitobacter sp. M57]|uniref:hypothetical protein n=1 Tax=unclassified Sulfitobacter TaxID=196795 RepID=UPI0023E1ADD8|nr:MULTISPECIES: hypothetical protein [unclassified Sulfitobacter]MDF3416461.1 hypothetical protein [Sulfitobacter sp. KE5]MDF3423984.1 hypothetical protein [Sulfitobacter sp. KE43]MDF3435085.1 hypothetical protein [Sulfitobacter sp. KE42]MDF3460711.1 hypothetical protein [Sulfitobacter sp. S74]MDF3464550.1 hypothetical protein [Sulfitobacter sp. Ks18]